MDVELLDIRQHIAGNAPFDTLSDDLLDEVAESIEVGYFRADTMICEDGQAVENLHYIRSGAVEVYRRNGELSNRFGEGDIFGYSDLLRNQRVRFPVKSIEDTLVYFIPASLFQRLCNEDEQFADFVEVGRPRLETTVDHQHYDNTMMTTRVRKLISRLPVMIEADSTIQSAAAKMCEQNVSSVLVLQLETEASSHTFVLGDGKQWRTVGILTDQDLRTRVLAAGRDADSPVAEVVTQNLIAIQSDESVHEAMLCMLRNNIHHLPVLHRRRPVGVLHLSDIIRYETNSSLYLVGNIYHQTSLKGLARLSDDVQRSFVGLVKDGANSQMMGSALSTIGRCFSRRLIELAEEELGPPPVPYCFMVMGSMARNEQAIVTDQDNALVLDDSFDPEQHDAYFLTLAQRVSDGLDACGYTYCKGDIMATNPRAGDSRCGFGAVLQ